MSTKSLLLIIISVILLACAIWGYFWISNNEDISNQQETNPDSLVQQETNNEEILVGCRDSDGKLGKYTFGTTQGKNQLSNSVTEEDYCIYPNVDGEYEKVESCNGDNCKVREFFCLYTGEGSRKDPQAEIVSSIDYLCDDGCARGVCL